MSLQPKHPSNGEEQRWHVILVGHGRQGYVLAMDFLVPNLVND